MRILTVSDENAPLWDHYVPGRLKEYDLILSCGDLNARYLSFLVTWRGASAVRPRESRYQLPPGSPEVCDFIDDHILTYNGVRIRSWVPQVPSRPPPVHRRPDAPPHPEAWRKPGRMGADIVDSRRSYGLGDGDPAHWGFESLVGLLDTYHPKYLVHGHVHLRYGARDRVRDYNGTTLINATERYTFEIPDRPVDGKELGQVIYKTRQGRDDPLGRC